jgi:hypothetical protein
MDVNALGVLLGIQEAAKQMIKQGHAWEDHQYFIYRWPPGLPEVRPV